MRAIRRWTIWLLMITLVASYPLSAAAEQLGGEKTTVLGNEFVKVTVDNATGRFSIRTVQGQPIRKNDQHVDMMFRGDNPETSFTTFRIDGTDYIFGNPYKFGAELFSEITPPVIVNNPNGTKQIETVWKIKGVSIKQVLMIYADTTDAANAGNVNVRYEVYNGSGADVQIGSRILLDTMLGGNDGPAFQVGPAYKVPLQVERKLVHNPEDNSSIAEGERALYKLPAYWVMKDKLDLSNPLATHVIAYGFNNISEAGINIVDEMVVGHWNRMANTKWDYEVNPNLDFTTDTNDYGTADAAVAFYWNPDQVAAGGVKSFETVYGLGELVAPEKVFSIRYLDPVNQLATLEDGSGYEHEGVFDINVEIENLASFEMEHSNMNVELTLDNGLQFVELNERGEIKRDESGQIVTSNRRSKLISYVKEATPEEAEAGIVPKYKPGETIAASYKVLAKGKAWPTTREYMVAVRSKETEAKLDRYKDDESIQAQYASSRANFVFLPAIGQGMPTYVYAMSPQEVYAPDVKYLTLNLSNIEAYNTGNDTAPPNFDLFLQEVATGERYKVPVHSSVLLQPAEDGQVGDMRITYRTGDRVDENGEIVVGEDGKPLTNLGPALPLGEYVVQIDFKGESGQDDEAAAMYDLTTTQRLVVSDNEDARLRQANLLAIVKRIVNLNVGEIGDDEERQEALQLIKEMYPAYNAVRETADGGYELVDPIKLRADAAAFSVVQNGLRESSKLVDPEYEVEPISPEDVPAYQLMAFESEEEFEAFKEELAEAAEQAQEEAESQGEDEPAVDEVLVEIRGMINQIGDGDEAEYVVDTTVEPAVINKSVAYSGKDMVFSSGKINIFGIGAQVSGIPFFDSLNVKGDGTLSVASSGFIFHRGEWTLDFFNGFNKSLERPEDEGGGEEEEEEGEEEEAETEADNPEDDSLNGSLDWAVGGLGDRLNPLRQLMIEEVYFNRHSLFSAPSFSISGFGLKFNEFVLREDAVSFGGTISMKIIDAEINNVMFNENGFVGIDTGMKFELEKSVGLLDGKGAAQTGTASGELNIVHYVQEAEGKTNTYGLKFAADLRGITSVAVEIEFKQVSDKRILPNVIAFSASLPDPGVMIAGGTHLTDIRGAIRELADTIAGEGDVPLTIEAGVDISFGVKPATFYGSIDLTLKRSGIKLIGKLDYSPNPESERVEMLKQVKIAAQWVKPWFVSASAEIDVLGWDVIIGKASIFLGENLEKNRIDFEGFVGAKVQVPSSVPVVGGMALGGVSLGVNNDKMWGSVSILFISLGITYYFDGDIEIGTSGEQLPDGLVHLQVQDPESGPKLVVFGQGIDTLATSWKSTERETHPIVLHSVAEGVELIDNGSMGVGIGGIESSNGGKTHLIPMDQVTGDALIEVEYYGNTPHLILKDHTGANYSIVYDDTRANPQANAFRQHIAAADSAAGVDVRKVYVAIPQQRLQGGSWTLHADQRVETKLMNVPKAAKLNEVKLTPDESDANKFTASWMASDVKAGDTVSLYLTKDAVANGTASVGGEEVANPGDTGLLIAKDLRVGYGGGVNGSATSGQTVIDVTRVPLLGDIEDIRGLLSQGDYYLRAELKSYSSFQTKTSAHTFAIVDPLAPSAVGDVKVVPAGNGYFDLSFRPGASKAGQLVQDGYEAAYAIEVFRQSAGRLEEYPNFGGALLFAEDELKPYWNAESGRYEGIRLGGWTAASNTVADAIRYTGLETGYSYVVGVSSANKPPVEADKNGNLHYANRVDAPETLLPVPSKPKLTAGAAGSARLQEAGASYIELMTGATAQSVALSADQPNVEVEAIYEGRSLGKVELTNGAGGSQGELLLTEFTTDGTYAIELKVRNKLTGDFSIVVLYLTVDTVAPMLYIDQPITGERTRDGKIAVSGTTSTDARLTVNGTPVAVQANGKFAGEVPAAGEEPTIALRFESVDGAGNRNEAAVTVTNGGYKVPVALVLRKLPAIRPEQTRQLEALLRLPDGLDENGKAKFKEVPVPEEDLHKVSYSAYMGDAAAVTEDGLVSGLRDGAAIVSASYRLSEDVKLESMTVVNVDAAAAPNGGLEAIAASVAPVSGNSSATRITVTSAGEMTGSELAYRRYAKSETPVLPNDREDASGWSLLPEGGVVPAAAGDVIVVVKRKSVSKLAAGVSRQINALVWAPGPISAYTEKVSGQYDKTRLVVANPGEMGADAELVYQVFDIDPRVPAAGESIAHYSTLPADGIISAYNGNKIIFALRSKSDKTVLQAAAQPITAQTDTFGKIGLTARKLANVYDRTQLVIESAAVGNEHELVYKVWSNGASVVLPAEYDDLSDWTTVPADSVIPARDGQFVVVAKRIKSSKQAVAASGKVSAVVESFGVLSASAKSVKNEPAKTQLVIADNGDMTGAELVYRVYAKGETAAVPTLYHDLSGWSSLPADGIVPAQAEDKAVVAKRSANGKFAIAASSRFNAVVETYGTIDAYSEAIQQVAGKTRIVVTDAGNLTGAELVYKQLAEQEAVPGKGADLRGYSKLPADGVIEAKSGSTVFVAKRDTATGLSLAASQKLTASVWAPSNSGGGFPGGGVPAPGGTGSPGTADVSVNGQQVEAELKDGRVSAAISQEIWQQAAAQGKTVSVKLPGAELIFPAGAAAGRAGNLTVSVGENGAAEQSGLLAVADGLGARLLGAGQGVDIRIEPEEAYADRSVTALIEVPDDVPVSGLTAIVLRDAAGNWTTVPWKLDMIGNQAYVRVELTGSGSIGFLSSRPRFADVDSADWARKSIEDAAGKLFMLGRGEDRFDPNSPVTRAEYPTVLLRVLGLMNDRSDKKFNDVASGEWFARSVAIAAERGIVDGYADGSFKPQETLTRLEAMVMAGRSLRQTGVSDELTAAEIDKLLGAFGDAALIPQWAREHVALCIKYGIITGQGDAISPEGTFTRAQAAAVSIRLHERIVQGM